MKKKFKRLLCMLLLMCLCFSEVVISPNVNTTISEAKKKKNKYKNYPKEKKVKVGGGYCWINKYSKPFLKYVSWNKEKKRLEFNYTGKDRVIHIPTGHILINKFNSDEYAFNETIEEIHVYDVLNFWTQGTYFSSEGDYNYYCVFYQCKNLKKMSIMYSCRFAEGTGPTVANNGTWVYQEWSNHPKTTLWKKDERIPINY